MINPEVLNITCQRPQNCANRSQLNPNLSLYCRRVASKSKAREGSQSCSPFGKKKKCKDKYLAKHSSSECISGIAFPALSLNCFISKWFPLNKNKIKSLFLQFLTSWMWFPMRRLCNSLLLKGKHLCSLVNVVVQLHYFTTGIKFLKVWLDLSYHPYWYTCVKSHWK